LFTFEQVLKSIKTGLTTKARNWVEEEVATVGIGSYSEDSGQVWFWNVGASEGGGGFSRYFQEELSTCIFRYPYNSFYTKQ